MKVELGNISVRRENGLCDMTFPVVTYLSFPGLSASQVMLALADPRGHWSRHSDHPPSWVWSDDELTEQMLADLWHCERGRPEDLEATHATIHHGHTFMPGEEPDEDGNAQRIEGVPVIVFNPQPAINPPGTVIDVQIGAGRAQA